MKALFRIDLRISSYLAFVAALLCLGASLTFLETQSDFLHNRSSSVFKPQSVLLWLTLLFVTFLGAAVIYLQARCRSLEKARGVDNHAACHDDLTGVANRRHFEQNLRKLLTDSAPCHSLMMIDLDRFKPVNDLYGHAAGDAVLKDIAIGLQKITGTRDLVARLGGDEFVLLMENTSDKKTRETALTILRSITQYRLNWKDQRIGVGASVGVVRINQPGLTASSLLSAADEALYSAKEAGRGAVFSATLNANENSPVEVVRIDNGSPKPISSARSHEPRDGRQPQLHAMAMAWTPPDQPLQWQKRTGSRRRREIAHWINIEPVTIGDHSSPGTNIRELIEDAAAQDDGGADLARWTLKMALSTVAQLTPTVIGRIGFVLPIPARAVVSVPQLSEELMRMNALAQQPIRHLTFVLHGVNDYYDSPAIGRFQQRLKIGKVHLGFEIRSNTLDVLAPLRYTHYDELHISRELVNNLKSGTSGKAAAETILTIAEQSGATLVATGADNVNDLRNLASIGVNRFSGQAVGKLEPLVTLLEKLSALESNSTTNPATNYAPATMNPNQNNQYP